MKLTDQPHVFDDFDRLVQVMQLNADQMTTPIFTIKDTSTLIDAWLSNLPVAERQHHNCNCCFRFIEAYGGMYTIDADDVHRTIWTVVPPKKYKAAVAALEHIILSTAHRNDKLAVTHHNKQERGRIVRKSNTAGKVFVGSQETGQFTHFEVLVNKQDEKMVNHYSEAMQRIANDSARFGPHMANLHAAVIQVADKRVETSFYFIQKWFGSTGAARRNLIASAHDGMTHWGSSTIGSMVDMLADGVPVDTVVSSTKKKLDPLAYQRPQALPTEGQINAAEKAFAEGGWESALKRRNLLSSEIPNSAVIWRGTGLPNYSGVTASPFASVRSDKQERGIERGYSQQQPMQMTWTLFAKSILPQAKTIQVNTRHCNPATLTTQQLSTAKPILRHDVPGARNPVAWWVPNFGVSGPEWSTVESVLRNVPEWMTGSVGDMVLLKLSNYIKPRQFYTGLFPELLTHEVRAYRAVVERFNAINTTGDISDGVTCIQVYRMALKLRVVTRTGATLEVTIDRFE